MLYFRRTKGSAELAGEERRIEEERAAQVVSKQVGRIPEYRYH